MIIGGNWLRIDKHHNGTYRVVNKSGGELAANLTHHDANVMCCAMCIMDIDEAHKDDQPVWLSFEDNSYHVTSHEYVQQQYEISIGTIGEIRKWHDLWHNRLMHIVTP